jgi:hypothetical protein
MVLAQALDGLASGREMWSDRELSKIDVDQIQTWASSAALATPTQVARIFAEMQAV